MEGYIAQVMWFAATFEPRNWAYCDGRLISIAQNTALFSLLGTTYGGNGIQTFALPDFRGRTVVGAGQGPGLSNYVEGQKGGAAQTTLTQANIPSHTHPATATLSVSTKAANSEEAPGSILGNADVYAKTQSGALGGVTAQPTGPAGGGATFSTRQPYLGMNFVICLYGIYPSRS